MEPAPLTRRIPRRLVVTDWAWWQLPPLLRCYVAAVPFGAVVTAVVIAFFTDWSLADLWKFALLAMCGAISVASTPRIAYTSGGLTRDFSSVWVLPTAILLPPVYAAVVPVILSAVAQRYVYRGVLFRRTFTAAATGLGYALASFAFHAIPASFAGGAVGSGLHAFTWAIAVAACELIGGRVHHLLILGAVKLTSPHSVRIVSIEFSREALQGLFAEIDLGVLITLAVGLSPAFVVIALPTVLLVRRFIIHPILIAQSRIDAKTGLLNVSTWEKEAEAELSRSLRTGDAAALAIVDIDHFKKVNDTHGHLVGDKVLRAVADGLRGQSRDYDRIGRFGGEEFVLLLVGADEKEACGAAERLRQHIGNMAVPVDARPDAPTVSVTVSVGVAAMGHGAPRKILPDLLSAADSALYQAKQAGRNRVCVSGDVRQDPVGADADDEVKPDEPDQEGPAQVGPDESGADQAGPDQAGPAERGVGQAGPDQAGRSHRGPDQAERDRRRPRKAGQDQRGPDQRGREQRGAGQAGPGQPGRGQLAWGQTEPARAHPA